MIALILVNTPRVGLEDRVAKKTQVHLARYYIAGKARRVHDPSRDCDLRAAWFRQCFCPIKHRTVCTYPAVPLIVLQLQRELTRVCRMRDYRGSAGSYGDSLDTVVRICIDLSLSFREPSAAQNRAVRFGSLRTSANLSRQVLRRSLTGVSVRELLASFFDTRGSVDTPRRLRLHSNYRMRIGHWRFFRPGIHARALCKPRTRRSRHRELFRICIDPRRAAAWQSLTSHYLN